MTRWLSIACVWLVAAPGLAQEAAVTTEPAAAVTAAPPSTEARSTEPESTEDMGDLEALLDTSVVTTASRTAERASSAPASVLTITADELRAYGMRTVDEALAYLGVGFLVSRVRNYPSGIDVGAQGMALSDASRHVLVLLDGHVMNAQDTGQVGLHEALGVPIEAIDHIEVVLGPGSVLYGSNAMLAVVHVFTRRAADDPGLHVTAEVGTAAPQSIDGQPTGLGAGDRAGLRYRFGLGFAHGFRLFGSDGEVTIRAEWLEEISNSYRTASFVDGSLQLNPGETAWGGVASHSMQAPSLVATARLGDFRLSIQASHYEHGIPLSGTFSDPLAREVRSFLRADLRHTATLDPHVTLTTRLYADLSDWSERSIWTSVYWCLPGQIDGCDFSTRSRGRWAGVEQQLAIDWNLDGRVTTLVGYDVRGRDATRRPADYVDRLTGAIPVGTRLPYFHSVSLLAAVFAQQVWQPFDWLTFNGGARLDVDTLSAAHLSPRLAVIVTPVSGTSIRASYSEAFRAPSALELYDVDPTYRARAGTLAPEVVRTGELEWQQRIEWLTFSLRGYVAFYEAFVDSRLTTMAEFDAAQMRGDFASTADPSFTQRYDNLSTMRTFGGTVSLQARPVEGLSLGASLAIQDTHRIDDPSMPNSEHEPVPLVPLWMGNARAAWTIVPHGATIAVAASFVGARRAFDDVGALTPHALSETLDLRATFTAPLDAVPGLSLRTSLSYSVNPFYPYLLDAPNGTAADAPVALYPVTSTLFGFVGLHYDLDP